MEFQTINEIDYDQEIDECNNLINKCDKNIDGLKKEKETTFENIEMHGNNIDIYHGDIEMYEEKMRYVKTLSMNKTNAKSVEILQSAIDKAKKSIMDAETIITNSMLEIINIDRSINENNKVIVENQKQIILLRGYEDFHGQDEEREYDDQDYDQDDQDDQYNSEPEQEY